MVAQTSHKIINQGIFEKIQRIQKKSISHMDVYGANGPKWTFSLIFEIFSKITLFYLCEIFELQSLENTQKINKWLSSL
jgi:hypothetical protein